MEVESGPLEVFFCVCLAIVIEVVYRQNSPPKFQSLLNISSVSAMSKDFHLSFPPRRFLMLESQILQHNVP